MCYQTVGKQEESLCWCDQCVSWVEGKAALPELMKKREELCQGQAQASRQGFRLREGLCVSQTGHVIDG